MLIVVIMVTTIIIVSLDILLLKVTMAVQFSRLFGFYYIEKICKNLEKKLSKTLQL